MPFNEVYRRQVSLLVGILPFVAEEECFALKGGTAINLFVRALPRLSVDIDLTYLPIADRARSVAEIDAAMTRIKARIVRVSPDIRIDEGRLREDGTVNKLLVRAAGAQVKLEVTPVLRGCVYEPEMRVVTTRVENEFGFAEARLVSHSDLYGGKIVAALDRQHPRDLFDVRDLLAHEGIDDDLRTAFIVYLLSHNRPMAEILSPTRKDISHEFERGFIGLTETPVTLEDLVAAREQVIDEIVGNMPRSHRAFLVSFEAGEPDWSLLNVPQAAALPAVKWRTRNLAKLPPTKRAKLVEELAKVLATP